MYTVIFFIASILFFAFGGLAYYAGSTAGEQGVSAISLIFCAAGVFLMYNAFKSFIQIRHSKKILKNGKRVSATVVGYTEGLIYVNDVPSIAVILEYIPVGKFEPVQEAIDTEEFNPDAWPIGSTVNIRYWNGEYAWDKKHVLSDAEIEERKGPRFL